MSKKCAFSLVELSIVLVILGLLVGGVLSGQSLIHAAELRAVTDEYGKIVTAEHTFRDKYFALPGDMTNATSFWGDACGANCQCNGAFPGLIGGNTTNLVTCNGDGNGVLDHMVFFERVAFWQQMAAAGLMENSSSTLNYYVRPPSKFNGAYWTMDTDGDGSTTFADAGGYRPPPNAIAFVQTYMNVLSLNSTSASQGDNIFKPEDAWNIDTKMDDGVPGTGKVVVLKVGSYAVAGSACTTVDGQTPPADVGGTYQLSDTNDTCALMFLGAF